MSDTTETPPLSAPLRAMADRMDRNWDSPFGGSFVIIPPKGDPIDMLILDRSNNPAIFWATLQSLVQIALAELDDTNRSGGFRR